MMRVLGLVVVVAWLLVGCGESGTGGSGGESGNASGASGEQSPQQIAQENSDLAAAALAESDKGVDESGDKVWKQDAREFFNRDANPLNRTFELPWQWAGDFTRQAYEAGAEKVWMVSISEFELGGEKFHVSDCMVVVLPKDPAARATLISTYNQVTGVSDDPTLAITDAGQKYLFIVGD